MKALKIGEPDGGEIVLYFSGTENEVDANSLGEIIVCISNIVHRVNCKISPDSEVRIVVTSFESGSFRVVIKFIKYYTKRNAEVVLASVIGGLIAMAIYDAVGYAITVVKSTDDNIRIEESKKRIEMPPGYKNYIDRISSDRSIHRNIYKIANTVYSKDSMNDLSIFLSSVGSDPVFTFSESSCQKIIEKYNMREETESASYKIEKTIQVRSADFERSDVKWKFTLDEAKISARILDPDFMTKVRSGHISIKANERLYVEIIVTETRYKVSGDVKSKEYEIERVLCLLDQ